MRLPSPLHDTARLLLTHDVSAQAMLGGKANPGADDVKKILGSGASPAGHAAAAVPTSHQQLS